jgi:arylsulfatase A-like enzyme
MRNASRRGFITGMSAALMGSLTVPGVMDAQQQQFQERAPEPKAGRPHTERPNIVIFMPDQLRADALACYGNPLVKTPNFDKLAMQGTRFEHCRAAYPICGASRCSMLTGWPVSVRGHRSQMYFLRPDEPNLFRYLRRAGYDVFWFGKNDALAAECFDDSVTEWNYSNGHTVSDVAEKKRSGGPGGPLKGLEEATGDRRDTSDYHHLRTSFKILERKETERPFCIFLPLLSPHPPYSAPEGFTNLYPPSDVTGLLPANLPNRPLYMSRIRAAHGLDKVSPDVFRRVRAAYLGKVSYADWLLGELMETLERTNHSRNTALLVFSDHGDYAGDYGMADKWAGGMEECLTRVPLLARVPGGAEGHKVSSQTELFDVMQTCLELAGTTAQHTHFSRSLLSQVHGGKGDEKRAAFSECGYNCYEPQCFPHAAGSRLGPGERLEIESPELVSRAASIKTNEYKLVSRPQGQSELYIYGDDPRELHNRFGERSVASIQAEAQQRLLHWYVNTTGISPWDRDQRGFPPYVPRPAIPNAASAGDVLDAG